MSQSRPEQVLKAVDTILAVLGEPTTDTRSKALDAFQRGDAGLLRLLAATNLDDHYLRSLGYLISAKSKPDLPTVAVVLAEAARAAADYARERTIDQLNQKIHLDLLASA